MHFTQHPVTKAVSTIMKPVAGLSLALFALPTFAEDTSDIQNLETITVTASALKVETPIEDTPKSVTIIDREELDVHDVIKLDEAFRYSTSVVSPYGVDVDTDWLLVRGFEPSVYLDGNRLYKEGFFGWSTEPYGMESIELLKGPSAIFYGDSQPGGVLNVVQKKPTDVPQGSINISGGSNDYMQLGIDVSGWANDTGDQRYRLVAMVNRQDGALDGTENERFYIAPSYTIDFNEKATLTLLTSFTKDTGVPNNGFFPIDGTYQALPDGGYIDPTTNYGQPDTDRLDQTQVSAGYQFKYDIDDVWTYKQNFNFAYKELYLRSTSAYQNDYDPAWGGDSDPNTLLRSTLINDGDSHSYTFDNNLTANFITGIAENTLMVGIDYQHHNNNWMGNGLGVSTGIVDSRNPTYDNGVPADLSSSMYKNDITKEQIGTYAQLQSILASHWVANLGLRYDWVNVENTGLYADKIDDGQLSFNTGLMYLADNGLSPYVSYSSSFYTLASLDFITNKLYEPIESKQTEVGVKYSPFWLDGYVNIAWFDIQQDNATTSVVGDNGVLGTSQTDQKSQGIELEGSAFVTENLKLTASYTYTNLEEVDPNGGYRQASLVPKNLASGWVQYDFASLGLPDLRMGTGVRYLGTSVNSTTGDKISAVTLWDAMASYQFTRQLQLQMNANNLLDKEYVASCSSTVCYYGEDRRVTANLNYSW
ncbi:TonB-dependent siderophore receptor [Vibrio aphrogenes]|uniref:TonB-dependent siderophore receptor n=1 Tax=Vibrio aphrogenes TaxID=1891186 RepID=UPI000B34C3F2|nr:TonB-dependent siderophore receptor [Vibrio aphrogenes]